MPESMHSSATNRSTALRTICHMFLLPLKGGGIGGRWPPPVKRTPMLSIGYPAKLLGWG